MLSGLSESNVIRPKGNHRVRFEQSWVELSSSLRKRTAQRRTAITESERSDSEWLYRTNSSGSESCSSSAATHLEQLNNNNSNNTNLGNSNGQTPVAGPAHTSYGMKGEGGGDEKEIVLKDDKRELQGPRKNLEKRVFAAPKIPVPVERRRQRTQKPGDENRVPAVPAINSLPLEQITDQQIVDIAIDSPVQTINDESLTLAHSVTVSDRIKTCEQQQQQQPAEWPKQPKKVHNQCGFFRQILSEEEVIYDMPNHYKASPEPLPVEEAIYTEPSLHSVCSTLTSFGERRPMFGVLPSSGDDDIGESSHYADPFERCGSLLEHNYEEMDFDEDIYQQHPFTGQQPIDSNDNTESGFSDGSKSSRPGGYFSSDSDASTTIPPGLARSRAAMFESIAQANQRVIHPHPGSQRLVQALGPQLALYSMNSLPPPEIFQSIKMKSKSCPPSLNAINWSMDVCVENDGFFMEFANQRIALPEPDSPTSCSSLQSSSDASSGETELTDRSKSSRKVSFVLGPVRSTSTHLLCHKFPAGQDDPAPLVTHKGKSISSSSTSTSSSAAVNLARFFKQTLTVIGRCGGEGQISDNESLISHPPDDLLSQSDLEMFCKSNGEKRLRKDSGTDMTPPDASLYGSTLDIDDIDEALTILEVKAKAKSRHASSNKQTETIADICSDDCSSSSDGSDMDSSSCSSGSSCESSCNLTDCTSWTNDCCSESLTSSDDDYRGGAISPGPLHDTSLDMTSSDNSRLDDPGSPTQPNDGKHSLLQFALYHFRQSPEKFEMLRHDDVNTLRSGAGDKSEKKKSKNKKSKDRPESVAGADWTWKEQVDLVKFTKSPIQASLLQLDSNELNKLALEGFLSIMKYMGDYPMAKGQSEVDSVYTILMNCHKHEALRDETYCQVMKQTTNNKSSRPDSCQRGWRLFSITAAYFSCSEVLKPYLFKYLETAAYDKRRAYHGTAMVCLQNLRKTLRYGGRKNVPSIEEITAITAGRNSKRQMYRLPGGTERVINTKSTSVVQDIIEEICGVINVRSEQEMEEYSLYCIVEGDTFTMPLAREEYILDVTTELQKNQQVYYLIFCRSVWHYPMRLDNALYIEIVFNQIAPDYLEGLLLVMPGEQISQDCVYDIAKVAALLHRAADLDHMPTMKETKYLLPKPALSVRDIKPPQWVNLVQSSWKEVEHFKPSQAKAQVLEVLEKWSLFGSSFFAVRRDADPAERSEHILALNRNGVHFLDVITHETLMHYPYSEVISTRKVKSEEGPLFLDMKCGNLMQQRVTRIQTDQAHEISRLIRQYITIQQRIQQQNVKEESNLASR